MTASGFGALDRVPISGAAMTGWLAPAVAALTDGASIAINAELGNVFRVTLGGNRTLANPSNPTDGQTVQFRVTQDGTGSRTLAYGSAYDFGSGSAPVLTTTASKMDILGFTYDANLSKWCYLGIAPDFKQKERDAAVNIKKYSVAQTQGRARLGERHTGR